MLLAVSCQLIVFLYMTHLMLEFARVLLLSELTYDQFLMSLMDPKARYQMRFHHLCDALIIMDEVQSLPCQLWQPLDRVFQDLVKLGSSKLLLMSATLPSFVSQHTPLVKDYPAYFSAFAKYKLVFNLGETMIF